MRSNVSSLAKKVLETAVTVVMGVAAVLLIWQSWNGPGRRTTNPPPPPGFQDISSSQLSTSISGDAYRGSDAASMVLIEYLDFQCPFCAKHASETFDQIERDFIADGRVQYVFRNYPIQQIHPAALPAAKAASCARVQDRYFEMRSHLFANQAMLPKIDWSSVATDVGLEGAKFRECLENLGTSAIDAEIREAGRLGVQSTPTFLLGRRDRSGAVQLSSRLSGAAPYAVFKEALESLTTVKAGGSGS
jgi:protein-disulfide isomerase